MGGGEGEAPSSEGLPNVGNGVADILLVVVAIVVVVLLVGSAWSAWHCRSKSLSQQRVQSSTFTSSSHGGNIEQTIGGVEEDTASVICDRSASAWWKRRARQTICYCRLSFLTTSFLETF